MTETASTGGNRKNTVMAESLIGSALNLSSMARLSSSYPSSKPFQHVGSRGSQYPLWESARKRLTSKPHPSIALMPAQAGASIKRSTTFSVSSLIAPRAVGLSGTRLGPLPERSSVSFNKEPSRSPLPLHAPGQQAVSAQIETSVMSPMP